MNETRIKDLRRKVKEVRLTTFCEMKPEDIKALDLFSNEKELNDALTAI